MKYYDLDEEEKEILADYNAGKYKPVKNQVQMGKMLVLAAKNTLSKTKNINLRLSEKVIIKLKGKAAALGLPYQTLASSVLHRFALSQK